MKYVQAVVIVGQSLVIGVLVGILTGQRPKAAEAGATAVVPVAGARVAGAEAAEIADLRAEVGTLSGKLDSFMEGFGKADENARINSVRSTLQTMRSQIELYKIQHADVPPGEGTLWAQLTHATNAKGEVGESGPAFPCGPYLQAEPINAVNGSSGAGGFPAANVGWVYEVKGTRFTFKAVNGAGNGVLIY